MQIVCKLISHLYQFIWTKEGQNQMGNILLNSECFSPSPRKQKLYITPFEYTPQEFFSIWETTKPRKANKAKRQELLALEQSAIAALENIQPFSFEAFEWELFKKRSTNYTDLISILEDIEEEKIEAGSVSTAEKYRTTKSFVQRFLSSKKRRSIYTACGRTDGENLV
jgi:hypothetical protein